MKVAALQMRSGTDPDANITVIEEAAHAAARQGAQYLLTPEVSVGFAADRAGLEQLALPFENNPHIERLAAIAANAGLFLHVGSMAIRLEDGKFANRSLLFGPDGKQCATYDKIHLYDADPPGDRPYRESATYHPGDSAIIAPLPQIMLGLSICYDLRFPALYTLLANAGAGLLAVPSAFTVPTGSAHWETLLRARAIETGSYVVAAAQGGQHENGRRTWGHSMIIDPWGTRIAHLDHDAPGTIYATIDPAHVTDARARIPALANARPFSLSVNHDLS